MKIPCDHGTCVRELMEEQVITIAPEESLVEAARKMKEANCGSLVVGPLSAPQGIITDRDIVVRALSDNLDPAMEKVEDHMTSEVQSCGTGDTLAEAAEKMRAHGVGRMLVTDDEGYVVGILSFGRILRNHGDAGEIAGVLASATGTVPPAMRAH